MLGVISRKTILGTKFTGSIIYNAGKLERNTNIGIHIDTSGHTVTELLD